MFLDAQRPPMLSNNHQSCNNKIAIRKEWPRTEWCWRCWPFYSLLVLTVKKSTCRWRQLTASLKPARKTKKRYR